MDPLILRFDRYNSPDAQALSFVPRIWLEVTRGRVRQAIRPVGGPVFLIGAAADCDLVVRDAMFPEVYAYLLIQDGSVSIRRVASEPELLLNGEPANKARVLRGDRLAFGPFELTVQIQFGSTAGRAVPAGCATDDLSWIAGLPDV